MDYLDAVTQMSDTLHGTCVAGGDDTDVLWVQEYDGSGPAGWAPCAVYVGGTMCDQVWIVVDVGVHYSAAGYCGGGYGAFNINMIATVRHELGHSVGLAHFTPTGGPCGPPNPNLVDDAMMSDWSPISFDWLDYNAHHISHIDDHY